MVNVNLGCFWFEKIVNVNVHSTGGINQCMWQQGWAIHPKSWHQRNLVGKHSLSNYLVLGFTLVIRFIGFCPQCCHTSSSSSFLGGVGCFADPVQVLVFCDGYGIGLGENWYRVYMTRLTCIILKLVCFLQLFDLSAPSGRETHFKF